jgi:hypothetical protein
MHPIKILLSLLSTIFSASKKPDEKKIAKEPAPALPKTDDKPDWSNPKSKISKYFTVNDALILREWKRLADETDGLNDEIKSNILLTAKKMDIIREYIGKPILIKSWLRPSKYNVFIGGAPKSAHMDGLAVDWWTDQDGDGSLTGKDCDELKSLLMPKLAEWEIRMEDNGKGARWVHIDLKPVKNSRFFKP